MALWFTKFIQCNKYFAYALVRVTLDRRFTSLFISIPFPVTITTSCIDYCINTRLSKVPDVLLNSSSSQIISGCLVFLSGNVGMPSVTGISSLPSAVLQVSDLSLLCNSNWYRSFSLLTVVSFSGKLGYFFLKCLILVDKAISCSDALLPLSWSQLKIWSLANWYC